jgi:hypothetical protein
MQNITHKQKKLFIFRDLLPKLSQKSTHQAKRSLIQAQSLDTVILSIRFPKGQMILKSFSGREKYTERWQTMLPAPTFKPGQQTTFSFDGVIMPSIRQRFPDKSNKMGGPASEPASARGAEIMRHRLSSGKEG